MKNNPLTNYMLNFRANKEESTRQATNMAYFNLIQHQVQYQHRHQYQGKLTLGTLWRIIITFKDNMNCHNR